MKIIKSFNIGDEVYFKENKNSLNIDLTCPVKSKILGYHAYYNKELNALCVSQYIVQTVYTARDINYFGTKDILSTELYTSLEDMLFNKKRVSFNDIDFDLNIGDTIYIYDNCSIKECVIDEISSININKDKKYGEQIYISITSDSKFYTAADEHNRLDKGQVVYFKTKNSAINYATYICNDYTKTK